MKEKLVNITGVQHGFPDMEIILNLHLVEHQDI